MVSQRVAELVNDAYGPWMRDGASLDELRRGFDNMCPAPPADVTVTEGDVGGVRGKWVVTPEGEDVTIVHFHSGGYAFGSSQSHRDFASRVGRAAQARVFLPDYTLVPEGTFPEPVNEGIAVYRALLRDGVEPQDLVVSGDSSGGGLALATLIRARSEGLPLPACVVAVSPWVDLALESDSVRLNEDPMSSAVGLKDTAKQYLAGNDPHDPLASPIYADLSGFPPLLVQAATSELLEDDAIRLAEKARFAGVPVELQIGYAMCHIYQMLADKLPEAQRSIEEIGKFIRRSRGNTGDCGQEDSPTRR